MKMEPEFYGKLERLFHEPRSEVGVGVAVAVAGAAVIGAGATAYAAHESNKGIKKANKANISAAERMNEANLAQDRANHGEGGFANLARYAKDAEGKAWEPQQFGRTLGVYNAIEANAPTIQDYQQIADTAAIGQAGAMQSSNELYNGQTQEQLLADQAKVSAGRIAQAYVAKGSALEALAATINEIKAIGSRKGYKSDGLGENMMNFEARRGAYNAGAQGLAQANVMNSQDEQRIKAGVINTRLSNTQLPYNVAKAGVNTSNLAADAMIDRTNAAGTLFNPFKVNQSGFQNTPLPGTVATQSTGQILGTGVANLATQYGKIKEAELIAQQNGGLGAPPIGTVSGPGGQVYNTQYENGFPMSKPYNSYP